MILQSLNCIQAMRFSSLNPVITLLTFPFFQSVPANQFPATVIFLDRENTEH